MKQKYLPHSAFIVWTSVHCAFAVETHFQNGEFVIEAQRVYHAYFMLRWNDAGSDRMMDWRISTISATILSDCIWKANRKKTKKKNRLSYHRHLAKFNCITLVAVLNIEDIFVVTYFFFLYLTRNFVFRLETSFKLRVTV